VSALADIGLLRLQFDRSFAEPARAAEDAEDFLALSVGGDGYAVRLADVTGLHGGSALAPLPTAVPEFLGIISLRGAVTPAWSLGALLGYGADREVPRWMILVGERGEGRTFALAFEGFEGHLRVPRTQVSDGAPAGSGPAVARAHVGQFVRVGDRWRGVLALDTIARAVERRLGLEPCQDGSKTR
jgi:chemotaxis signal transduction protein